MTRYNKSIIAGLAFLLAALKVVSDGLGDAVVSSQEAVAALVAGIAALLVYFVPNTPPAGQPSDPSMSETDPEAGVSDMGLLAAVCLALLLVVVLYAAGVRL